MVAAYSKTQVRNEYECHICEGTYDCTDWYSIRVLHVQGSDFADDGYAFDETVSQIDWYDGWKCGNDSDPCHHWGGCCDNEPNFTDSFRWFCGECGDDYEGESDAVECCK